MKYYLHRSGNRLALSAAASVTRLLVLCLIDRLTTLAAVARRSGPGGVCRGIAYMLSSSDHEGPPFTDASGVTTEVATGVQPGKATLSSSLSELQHDSKALQA